MEYIFFSVNNFNKTGGGPIRMLGILNSLAEAGNDVLFISNAKNKNQFHSEIKHIYLDYVFTRRSKRVFQSLLALMPLEVTNSLYMDLYSRLEKIFKPFSKEVIFFEYLDNSIGYWLYKNKLLSGYINDIHGVATLEFQFQADNSTNPLQFFKFKSKYILSRMLDNKVFNNAFGLILASISLKKYYLDLYPKIANKKLMILPYLISNESCQEEYPSFVEKDIYKEYNIDSSGFIILFAGAFKQTGGVPDLINAFQIVAKENLNVTLLLIGDGPTMEESKLLVENKDMQKRVKFIGRTSYQYLRSFQSIADLIVCPDKQNVYSELIIHVKYLDALASGKIVINGSFPSVLELNIKENLSINFIPSNVDDLADKISYCIKNKEKLKIKYQKNRTYVYENLTYLSYIHVLEN